MLNNFHINFKAIIFILLLTVFQNIVSAEVINKINVTGNDRISNETVIMFSNLNVGDRVDQNNLNNALKEIYLTDYFKNVILSIDNGIVEIKVEENPIIQSVLINGVDENRIYDQIKDITNKIEKYPFTENRINDQTNLLKNLLKNFRYYFVELGTSITTNDNNTVDLVYDFDLGEIAKIKKINFIGNKIFRDSTLRNIISSEEDKFWKFLTRKKFLDSNRVKLDVAKLTNFYQNRGYFNAKVKSTNALINDKGQFELIFNINAGQKYLFGEIKINDTNKPPEIDLNDFEKKFLKLSGKNYSKKRINKIIDDVNNYTLKNDFVFLNANFDQIITKENNINVIINFDDLEKVYVERINVLGNFITDEKVIRNSLIIDEGDPYNNLLFDKSIQSLKARNIFKKVDYKVSDGKNLNKVIDLSVEEKATGEIFAGAGTGTTGSTFSAGIKENNYSGLGIQLDTDLTLTDDSIKGKFSINNPNYNNSDKSMKLSVESSTNDLMSISGYKTSRTGVSIGTEFEQMNNFFVNIDLSNFYEDLETSSNANSIVKKQEGNYFENLITYSVRYNMLDQNFQPTDGYVHSFEQTLPIYSDDLSIENQLISSVFHSLNEDIILSARFFLKTINSLEDNVRVSKRVYVPNRYLRGFESGKIGPKEGTQYIGGNYASSINFNSTMPDIFFENENIDLNLFLDLANVWEVDYNNSLDSNKIRSATGISIDWFSPIGPLSFSYAIPLSEADTDITEKFRFRIGTSF